MLQAFSDMIHEAVKAVGRTLRAVLRWIADMLYKLWPRESPRRPVCPVGAPD